MIFREVETFNIDEITYFVDQWGNFHQKDPEPYIYDSNYVSVYDTNEYSIKSSTLNRIRSNWVKCNYGERIYSLLDYGYGNGAFLFDCEIPNAKLYGYDIANTTIPTCATRVNTLVAADVYTFWDSLEHVHDLEFVRNLACKGIAISLPNLKEYYSIDECISKFRIWKHRKPNEHVHHFTKSGVVKFFKYMGWTDISVGHPEDHIRVGEYPNILSAFFKKSI